MSDFHKIVSAVLSDDTVCAQETGLLAQYVAADNRVDHNDVRLLVELYSQAETRCGQFDELFFSVLEGVLLADGSVASNEEYYLLKMLYSDGQITPAERDLLARLERRSPERSASFEALLKTAAESPDRNWCVGGVPR